ncbi:hypothetical protein GWK08_07850 [Leptobacterium flavescens]|uniref:Right-handed parallel beta-helix repeat-containing protein n=1 Tax=Leptobacterium flavescens TaxID=472055 RepID=A0A6P0UK57_9FLAO|nr:hypothetical protein [Leptobacterium flavescens]NER13347.1 hypothetical protein [Leptobacterium flavescens]
MKRGLTSILLLALIILWSSCRKDFETVLSSGNLEFSRDTVYLDTVFTNIGSSTFNLKVFNRSSQDIRIPSVRLGDGEDSRYRLNVDGVAGKVFEDVEILARDSIFIFIETTVDIQDFVNNETQFLYTDAIEFDSGSNQQDVELVTLVQDAIFLFPQRFDDGTTESILLGIDDEGNETRLEGFFLEDDELNFTNEKPYVIYGYAGVGNGQTLQIDAGARVHFHENSGIIVANGGTLEVNGSLSTDQELLENEVIFEGDRLEPSFSNIPGQWGTVWLTAGSTGHSINYLTLKNSTVGILVDGNDGSGSPTLNISNSQIHNASNVGLWGRTAFIDAENLVIGNAGQASLYCNIGGNYNFRHCTFANFWRNSFRDFPAVLIDNFVNNGDGTAFAADLEAANFSNSIVTGNNNIELFLTAVNEATFNFNFADCLIQFEDFNQQFTDNPLLDFTNNSLYQNIVLNMDAAFSNPDLNDFRIGENSSANGIGNVGTAQLVPLDILGVDRTASPDLGAYQSTVLDNN